MGKPFKLLDAVITTTTSPTKTFYAALPNEVKAIMARIAGTGTVTATLVVDYSPEGDGVNWYPAFTIALSGTNSDAYVGFLNTTNNESNWRVRVTSISGAGAAVTVEMEP
jgi:hypothetical protein